MLLLPASLLAGTLIGADRVPVMNFPNSRTFFSWHDGQAQWPLHENGSSIDFLQLIDGAESR